MQKHPLTDNLPDYETVQRFLQILAGTRYSDYVAMMNDISSHIGNPNSQVNWKDPDSWIPQRLIGENRELALKLWRESDHRINPRHSYDMRSLSVNHHLAEFSKEVVELTDKGKRFFNNDDAIIRAIDQQEGIQFILSEVIENGLCKRLDLIEPFTTFCHTNTTWKAQSSIDSALSARFRHLRERKLIERIGHTYQATDAGISYLMRHHQRVIGGNGPDLTIHKLVSDNNKAAEKQLAKHLQTMDPYRFEHLIKRLLEEMGYSDVEVTAASNDKGVDVVAEIELGISHVREVIQVKRQKSNIGRPILDQLRGSLHYFQAVRGSIISTSGFAKNAQKSAFAPGVAPITLIDGDRLVNLLIEHNIGMRRREVRILEFDAENLRQFDSEEEPILPSSRQLESE